MTDTEIIIMNSIAQNLGINPAWLYNLIQFESKWDPQARNPYSSAKGLIQFTDSTAKGLGFKSSEDLVSKAPSILAQLPIVERYLTPYEPFPTRQSLYMAVFYPAARSWPVDKVFPDSVRAVNPGINTVGDYVNKVDRQKGAWPIVAALVLALFLFLLKGKVL